MTENQTELWLDVSRTLVQSKYRSPVEKNVTAVFLVDIPRALSILKERYDLVPKKSDNEENANNSRAEKE